jgi:hypothetical protein
MWDLTQGCQMVYFHSKHPYFVLFWRAWDGKMLVYFMPIWYMYIFCDHLVYLFCGHLVYFIIIWYILWSFRFRLVFSPVFECCTKKNLATLVSHDVVRALYPRNLALIKYREDDKNNLKMSNDTVVSSERNLRNVKLFYLKNDVTRWRDSISRPTNRPTIPLDHAARTNRNVLVCFYFLWSKISFLWKLYFLDIFFSPKNAITMQSSYLQETALQYMYIYIKPKKHCLNSNYVKILKISFLQWMQAVVNKKSQTNYCP